MKFWTAKMSKIKNALFIETNDKLNWNLVNVEEFSNFIKVSLVNERNV